MTLVLARTLAVLFTWCAFVGPSIAQSFPSKSIEIISAFPPGGANDVAARALADGVRAIWGVPVLVVNKPGAGGTMGTAHAAKAPPDGYTWLIGVPPNTINMALMPDRAPNVLKHFVPVAQFASTVNYLVVPSGLGVKTVAEYVSLAKSQPGKLSYGTAGLGSTPHIGFELFKQVAGIDVVAIHYQGTPQVVPDLMNGLLSATYMPSALTIAQAKSPKFRVLAVVYDQRTKDFPDVPALHEVGYADAAAVVPWYAVLVPINTPQHVVARIERVVKEVLAQPSMLARLDALGALPTFRSASETTRLIQSEIVRMRTLVEAAKLQRQ